jgi:hypothetical protein
MPRRKLRDVAPVRAFREIDIFAQKIGFNIAGEEKHRTVGGAFISLLMLAWLVCVGIYLVREIILDNRDKPLTTILYPNYFDGLDFPIKQEQGWQFAVGLSSITDYGDQTD